MGRDKSCTSLNVTKKDRERFDAMKAFKPLSYVSDNL